MCRQLIDRASHLRQHILDSAGSKTTSLLYSLHNTGILKHDVASSKRQLLQEGEISTQVALSTLREANDFETLLNYYNSKQDVGVRERSEA